MWMVPTILVTQVLVGFNGGDENDLLLRLFVRTYMNQAWFRYIAGRDSDGNVLPVIEQDKTSDEGFNPRVQIQARQ